MKQHKAIMIAAGLIALVGMYALVDSAVLWSQESASEEEQASQPQQVSFAKNLQVLEFDSLAELQTYMKTTADSMGVTCNYCHDLSDFSKDPDDKHKVEARKFMRMVKSINETTLKDYEKKVTCFTCHRGREHPVTTQEEWMKIQAEQQN